METPPLYSVLTSVPEEEEEDLRSYQTPQQYPPANLQQDPYTPYPQYPWTDCQPMGYDQCGYFDPMVPANTYLTSSSQYINSQYSTDTGYQQLNTSAHHYEQDYYVDDRHMPRAASSIPTSIYYRTIPARPSYRSHSSSADELNAGAASSQSDLRGHSTQRRCMTPNATLEEGSGQGTRVAPASHHLYGEMSMDETRRIINDIDQLIEH